MKSLIGILFVAITVLAFSGTPLMSAIACVALGVGTVICGALWMRRAK